MSVAVEDSFDAVGPYFFYRITCKDSSINVCYIGKTKNFCSRTSVHKTQSKVSETKLYKFIRENGSFDNFDIKVIHKCICDDKSSIYIEISLIKQHKEQGYEMLNIQIPNSYPKQEYNKMKCDAHYAIKKECPCGWSGSKMNYSKHIKTSKKHRDYCIKKFEEQIECVMIVQDGKQSTSYTLVGE
jgi:hypothetical protein